MPNRPDEFAELREAVWLNGPMFPLTVAKMEKVIEWARKYLAVEDLLAGMDQDVDDTVEVLRDYNGHTPDLAADFIEAVAKLSGKAPQ